MTPLDLLLAACAALAGLVLLGWLEAWALLGLAERQAARRHGRGSAGGWPPEPWRP